MLGFGQTNEFELSGLDHDDLLYVCRASTHDRVMERGWNVIFKLYLIYILVLLRFLAQNRGDVSGTISASFVVGRDVLGQGRPLLVVFLRHFG